MRDSAAVRGEVQTRLTALARERHAADADGVLAFLSAYYSTSAPEDLTATEPLDLYGAALAHQAFGASRPPDEPAVRVIAPRYDVHGWASRHAAVQVVTDDMPFVVDSVRMAITAQGIGIHVLHHPIIDGESYVHVDVDRHAASDAESLEAAVRGALQDVRAAVADWRPMHADLIESARRLQAEAAGHMDDDELAEAVAFLEWMAADNFTFLGVRSYDLRHDGSRSMVVRVPGTGLGILAADDDVADETELSEHAAALAAEVAPLVLTKANAMATVHRPAQLDYVGVRRFDEHGTVIGERRYLGLYASPMYTGRVTDIPLLRRKAEIIHETAGYAPGTHSARDLAAVLDTYPRHEMLQASPRHLAETAVAIHELQDRRLTRVFLRRDDWGRFWSALVFLPRDRYNTDSRLAIREILSNALDGHEITYGTRVSESTLARLHFTIASSMPAEWVDAEDLEDRIAIAVKDWSDELHDLLVEEHGEDAGVVLADRYGRAFGPGYRAEHPPRTAVADIGRLEALEDDDIQFHLYRRVDAPTDEVRLRVYRSGPAVLVSDLVPLLENLGAAVIDQRPHDVNPSGGARRRVSDIGLRVPGPADVAGDGERVVDALRAVWDGLTQSDGLHHLILGAGLTWREVNIVRAYSRYLRQIGIPFSPEYVERCITAHPDIAHQLVTLFHHHFGTDGGAADQAELSATDRAIEAMLDEVSSLDEDRILRALLGLVRATLRTNAAQCAADGSPKGYLAFKFDPSLIPELPLPRPYREIFVYSPRVEGVHLRGAAVARGGLRWSDRLEDYRTEVLGLMKAQMVKNAVIVPSGAKGGFVAKRLPEEPDARLAEVVECYRTFISGLLDLTDNLAGDVVVPPPDVVRRDGDDPYLVVAADKGTATFSDIANDVAAQYGFWLGDAFASGGSVGYDHKGMGITARGAWESVKRHFRELGVDVQTEPVSVVGIGDMGGDVFGNGMLLSTELRLIGAFNHQHIFLDPDPDPAASFAERKRLFQLPRSSWDDYDRSAISAGGGVHPRSAKSIDITPEVRAALGVDAEAMRPNDLIAALLRAPVDLLWNGGIGTYVKASSETHAEVGDKSNDSVRVNGSELRCRVVGEGGNLGVTQRGRIEFARDGGRVNTDAIDNSAGVDTSDHEVNIKIALDGVVAAGDLTVKQRGEVLAAMTDDVASLVLADNVRQNQALVNAVVQAPSLVDVHLRYLRFLEAAGSIDRTVEFLPSDEELIERKAAGHGLTSPEFAVLLAYTKNLLVTELLAEDLPDDPWCDRLVLGYFPPMLRQRYPDVIRNHRLRREIVATAIANEVVDHQGITSMFRIRDETGTTASEAARSMIAATELFELTRFRAEVKALDHRVASEVQTQMLLEARKLGERGARWLLRQRIPIGLDALLSTYGDGVATLTHTLPDLLVGSERVAYDRVRSELAAAGVPDDVASWMASFEELLGALDCVELAIETGRDVTSVAAVRFELEDRLGLRWLMDRIVDLGRDNRWQSLARLSMREDLHCQLSRLTGLVVDATDPADRPTDRVLQWITMHDAEVARLAHVLAEIRAATPVDLATTSVGLREVTKLG